MLNLTFASTPEEFKNQAELTKGYLRTHTPLLLRTEELCSKEDYLISFDNAVQHIEEHGLPDMNNVSTEFIQAEDPATFQILTVLLECALTHSFIHGQISKEEYDNEGGSIMCGCFTGLMYGFLKESPMVRFDFT